MEYFTVTKMFMSALGQWPYQNPLLNRVIRFIGITSFLCLFIPVITALYMARNNFDDLLICIPMNFTGVIFSLSCTFLIVKTPKILFLLNRVFQDFRELQPFVVEIGILRKSAEEGRHAVLVYMIYVSISYALFCIVALLPPILDIISPLNDTRPKSYIAEVEYIFFDKDEYYSFVYLHSSIVGSYVLFTITVCDIVLYSLIQHACGMYRVLWYRLQNIVQIKNVDNEKSYMATNVDEIYRNVIDCVLLHIQLVEYTENINSCFSTFLFFTYGCAILLMIFQGAMIVIKMDDLELVLRYSTYSFGQAVHLIFNCIPGQMLVDHSSNVINYLYASNWHLMPSKIREALLLMMVRSLRESRVTVGKLATLSMETYSSTLKSIFSYLSVLTSMCN